MVSHTGDEWGEPKILQSVTNLIFANPNADEGLLLFTLGCWLDMQAKYTVVWNNYRSKLKIGWKEEVQFQEEDSYPQQNIYF